MEVKKKAKALQDHCTKARFTIHYHQEIWLYLPQGMPSWSLSGQVLRRVARQDPQSYCKTKATGPGGHDLDPTWLIYRGYSRQQTRHRDGRLRLPWLQVGPTLDCLQASFESFSLNLTVLYYIYSAVNFLCDSFLKANWVCFLSLWVFCVNERLFDFKSNQCQKF